MVVYHQADITRGYQLIECVCQSGQANRAERLRLARRDAEMDDGMVEQTFETFDPSGHPSHQQGHDAARRFADDPRGFLVLAGPPGTGKTHLLAAIGNHLLSRQGMAATVEDERRPSSLSGVAEGEEDERGNGRPALAGGTNPQPTLVPVYCVAARLNDRLGWGAGIAGGSESGDGWRYWDRLLDAGVLLLDDLGTERETSTSQERLFKLVDWRYANRRPTVIATNLTANELPPRLRSRLSDRALVRGVRMEGIDYRGKKR